MSKRRIKQGGGDKTLAAKLAKEQNALRAAELAQKASETPTDQVEAEETEQESKANEVNIEKDATPSNNSLQVEDEKPLEVAPTIEQPLKAKVETKPENTKPVSQAKKKGKEVSYSVSDIFDVDMFANEPNWNSRDKDSAKVAHNLHVIMKELSTKSGKNFETIMNNMLYLAIKSNGQEMLKEAERRAKKDGGANWF